MNKKFLSAILFGALMVTSTGTFVSCKDYDDDIDRLDQEISNVKDAIKALEDKVGSGKYSDGTAEPAKASTADGEPILIGALYPMTGALADSGQNMKDGIDLAVEEINAAGGISGRPIQIVYGDTQGANATGMTEMERLITQDKVMAVMGAYQSGVTEVVSQVAENYQVPTNCEARI